MATSKNRLRFTKAQLENIAVPVNGRAYFNDEKCPGLQLAVTPTGNKSFYFYKKISGKPRRIFIGHYPDLTPEQARRAADKHRADVALGIDPQVKHQQAQARAVTLAQAFEAFKVARNTLRPHTLYEYENYLNTAFGDWRDKRIVDIDKDMVARRHQKLATQPRKKGYKATPAYADGAMRFLRSLLNFAIAQYEDRDGNPIIAVNPVTRLSQTRSWHRPKRRRTVIKRAELPAWLASVMKLRDSDVETSHARTVGDYLITVILTGLRKTEAAELQWEHIDLLEGTLTIPDPKNREPHTLPLSDYLQSLLETRKKFTESAWVFPGRDDDKPLKEPRYQMEKVMRSSNVDFRLHDLRRTFSTIAESLDIAGYTLKRLLNHKMSSDVTAGYIVTDVERLRRPMQRITDFILSAGGVRAAATVTPLPVREVVQ